MASASLMTKTERVDLVRVAAPSFNIWTEDGYINKPLQRRFPLVTIQFLLMNAALPGQARSAHYQTV